ncbi:hypothetical protein OIU77_021357 [Salix suchowensis]|uniref:Uncharacterized protein n=1 Tax=Salix suchowensis TaxID=1278906 RepID=A0ABQ9CCV3_9ROSI|nr:hypothetical protein OIU77_021357 [Salix suchowensis]
MGSALSSMASFHAFLKAYLFSCIVIDLRSCHLRRSLIDGVIRASRKSKPSSFLSHPIPECSCLRFDLTKRSPHSTGAPVEASLGITHHCPKWMDSEIKTKLKDKESEEDPDEDISSTSGLFFRNSGGNHESGGGELIKEESQLDDQEELDGAD